jgi:hypothetical protein
MLPSIDFLKSAGDDEINVINGNKVIYMKEKWYWLSIFFKYIPKVGYLVFSIPWEMVHYIHVEQKS